jgi:hypothetical protein
MLAAVINFLNDLGETAMDYGFSALTHENHVGGEYKE